MDLGCGGNSPLSALRQRGLRAAGLDGSEAVLEEARKRALFDDYIRADMLEWLRAEAAGNRAWDVVAASHVIEHLPREAGEELPRLVEGLRPRLVYIETPYGFVESGYYHGDPLQAHRSGWFPWDFQARGYTVFGSGIRGLRGVEGRSALLPEVLTRQIERGLQWFVFRRPAMAFVIAAIRHTDENGNVRRV